MSTPPPNHPKQFRRPILIGQVASSESDGNISNPWGPTPKGKRRKDPERIRRKLPIRIGQINSSDSSGEVAYRQSLASKGKDKEEDDGARAQNPPLVPSERGVRSEDGGEHEMLSFYYDEMPGSGSKAGDQNRASSKNKDRSKSLASAAASNDRKADLEEVEARQGLILCTVLLHRQLQYLADQIGLYQGMDSLFEGGEAEEPCRPWLHEVC